MLILADPYILSTNKNNDLRVWRVQTYPWRVTSHSLRTSSGYNLVALPAAAFGFVAPWMAAIGMSSSSLLVVLNALRLTRSK